MINSWFLWDHWENKCDFPIVTLEWIFENHSFVPELPLNSDCLGLYLVWSLGSVWAVWLKGSGKIKLLSTNAANLNVSFSLVVPVHSHTGSWLSFSPTAPPVFQDKTDRKSKLGWWVACLEKTTNCFSFLC